MSIRGIKNENKKVAEVMNWEIYPSGIYEVLKEIKNKYNFPVYIMENGLPDSKDKQREEFIKDHLFYVHKAIEEGVNVKGYNYWSLLDNFEWDKGFWPRFGLVEIDYKTLERHPRKSFYAYRDIIKNNGF
jgi:beta-glucosidase